MHATSQGFGAPIGVTRPATLMSAADFGFDFEQFSSEGAWAFCRFADSDIEAARIGFQCGAFDLSAAGPAPDRNFLQLHLEVLTREGAYLWLPSGRYSSEQVQREPGALHLSLGAAGQEIFSYRGWPTIECRMCSDDALLQAELKFRLQSTTVLPDGILPQCVFCMWESMGVVEGTIRHDQRSVPVRGTVFFDHTRIIRRRSDAPTRAMSLYTTLAFDQGGGLFGYWAVDEAGAPIRDYCFAVYLDAGGGGRLLTDVTLSQLLLDEDGIARSWQLELRDRDLALSVRLAAREHLIRRCWGAAHAPTRRADYSIIPLVLDGSAELRRGSHRTRLRGSGLAEYHDARRWRANSQAARASG
ncbi:MAG: hypothetical protein ACRESY_06155 [Steroidobacteraceae bacterium]